MRQNKSDKLSRLYIKQIREDSGLLSKEFAERLGISLTYLKEFENDTPFTAERLVKLFIKMFDLTHISVSEMMLRETEFQLKKLEIEQIKNQNIIDVVIEQEKSNAIETTDVLVREWINKGFTEKKIYDEMMKETDKQLKLIVNSARGE